MRLQPAGICTSGREPRRKGRGQQKRGPPRYWAVRATDYLRHRQPRSGPCLPPPGAYLPHFFVVSRSASRPPAIYFLRVADATLRFLTEGRRAARSCRPSSESTAVTPALSSGRVYLCKPILPIVSLNIARA